MPKHFLVKFPKTTDKGKNSRKKTEKLCFTCQKKNHPSGSRFLIRNNDGQKEAPQYFSRAKHKEPSTGNSILTENILRSEKEIKPFSDEGKL